MDYALHLYIMATLYASLALSLQLLIGYAGLFSVAQAGLFGLGAYAAAISQVRLGLAPITGPVVGALAGATVCYVFARVLVRLKREEFFLASLALQIALIAVFTNAEQLTGGALGMSGLTPYLRDPASNRGVAAALSSCLLVFTLVATMRLTASPLGRALRASRENEAAALSCGKDIALARRSVFVLTGFFAAACGAVYANYTTAIDASAFSLPESILLISIVVVGGSESLMGTVVAALALVLMPEALRFLPLSTDAGHQIRQIVFGGLFLIVVCYRPEGVLRRSRCCTEPYRLRKGGER